MGHRSKEHNNVQTYTLDSDEDKKDAKCNVKKETIDPKILRKIQKIAKKQYFEENDCKEIDPREVDANFAEEIGTFNISDYDAWVVQCPKNIDPTALINKRIKIPGRRYLGNLQVRATPYPDPVGQAIGYINERKKYKINQIPLSGVLMVSKRLNQHDYADDEEANQDKPKPCKPQKLKLPVRHPFFGCDYKSRINMDKRINKRLSTVESTAVQVSMELRKKANFYKIRQVLQATTQSLAEKELLVRQSVMTGVRPKFMSDSLHPDYVAALNSAEKKQKRRKRKANESVADVSDAINDAPSNPKKKKLHPTEKENELDNTQLKTKTKEKKRNKDIQIDLTDNTFQKFTDDGARKGKKSKQNDYANSAETKTNKLLSNANESIDLTIADVSTKRSVKKKDNITDKSIVVVDTSSKKQRKKKTSDCEDVVKEETLGDKRQSKNKKNHSTV